MGDGFSSESKSTLPGKAVSRAPTPHHWTDGQDTLAAAEKWLDLAQGAEAPRVGQVQSPDEKAAIKAANNPSHWDQLMARRS